ncbi:hypothetical protein F5Y17DRAFT_16299 [Xylariaceae sp. FL0594]|nr:hypothetical protein F5Y17DRAFT_16299 [Xylariaceae sp. FL0594]
MQSVLRCQFAASFEMEAMDVDESESSRRLALIRAVRTLDEDDSLSLPDKIHKIWLLLTAVKHTRLHGVEESILRWLLKQMSGSNDAAEHVRRCPLTWTILAHVFPKIPSQALGRSLAYLRFVAILNKTLGDVTKPGSEEATPAKKRKRGEHSPATLSDLRTPSGCIKTSSEIFQALGVLLDQGVVYSGGVSPEKRVGAEHVKSLFSSSGEESRDITARLLALCDKLLQVTDDEAVKGRHAWIDTLSTIWNLRLHSKDDGLEFAKHIYHPASTILAKLESGHAGVQAPSQVTGSCCEIWVAQLRRFLSTHFIRPARQHFAVNKTIDILKLALQIAQKDIAPATTVMWSIAARAPRDASDPKSKVEHGEWAEAVFQAVVEALQPLAHQKRNEVLSRLLDTALETDSIPGAETLRAIYEKHALGTAETDWTLVSKILACDADVFLITQKPDVIFDKIAEISSKDKQKKEEVVADVIVPLEDAFSKARDLPGFVTRWFRGLCAAKSVQKSIWFDSKIREHLAAIFEASLSGTQLVRLLEDLESVTSKKGELLVVLDGICAGLSGEKAIATVDSKITSLLDREYDGASSDVIALKWRVAGYLASWETTEVINKLWKKIKSDLKPLLKKGPLGDAQTFEAFSCCYKFCLANHIGGKYEDDLTKLICTMVERLVASVKTEADLELLSPYMDLVFSQLPRLSEQPKNEANTLTEKIVSLFWRVSSQFLASQSVQPLGIVRPLIHNCDVADEEALVDAAVTPLLGALDGPGKQNGWTQPHPSRVLATLLEFPVEMWTRGRRKRMMSSWKKQKTTICSQMEKDAEYALAIMRLLVKIAQQPTLYEDMEFIDLIDVCSSVTAANNTLVSLAQRFVDNTITHVIVNMNESSRAYLASASQWANGYKLRSHSEARTPLIILKSLVLALAEHRTSSTSMEQLGVDPVVFIQKLADLVQRALTDFASGLKASSVGSLSDTSLQSMLTALDAARALHKGSAQINLSDAALNQLDEASNTLVSKDIAFAWKLRSFLVRQNPVRYSAQYFCAILEQDSQAVEEDLIHDFVESYMQHKDQSFRDQVLTRLLDHEKFIGGPIAPLVAARRLLQLHEGPDQKSVDSPNTPAGLDLAKIHEHIASHLSQTESLVHFKQISEMMMFLLDKHAGAMSQYNIEATLTSVVQVCSTTQGPKIQESSSSTTAANKAAGEIFSALFKLVALIIKRHRLRISGHFHILLTALRALLSVLLVDPTNNLTSSTSSSSSSSYSRHAAHEAYHPPWLQAATTRLQPRHGERFARLLTLICEPSAASVARSRSRTEALDSATDKAKRAAGQFMYLLLEVYVKLQLEVEVSRDMRKALEVGVFSVLDITSEGNRKVLNESLDAAGRAVFRALFGEYRKFGKWKGV